MNLRYDLNSAPNLNPGQVMHMLGITYDRQESHPIVDQIWYFNCINIPETLPEYLKEL